MTKLKNAALLAGMLGLLGGLGGGCGPETKTPVEEPKHNLCSNSDECPKGFICGSDGICAEGECVVAADCPHPADQICDLNKCKPNPDSPIGNECPNGTSDCDMGEFCSAGHCYDVSQSTPCTRSTACSAGQRCDPVNGFCVEDRGGCNRAHDYPELACPEGETCDATTGHCAPPGGIPCTPATAEEDCGGALKCIGLRCVQCTTNDRSACDPETNPCCEGFGTQCNVATGTCVSAFLCSVHEDCTNCLFRPGLSQNNQDLYCSSGASCSNNDDCSSLTDKRCATSTGECVNPECVEDSDCRSSDARLLCDEATLRCYLPPADCSEANEPNNAYDNATQITGEQWSDILCRGDIDMMRIPGHAGTRLRVTIGFTSSMSNVTMGLYDTNRNEIASIDFSYDRENSIQTDVTADGAYYVKVMGAFVDQDQYNYTLTVEEGEQPACTDEEGEPNDLFENAGNSVLAAGVHTRSLCSISDSDYHQITAPAQMGLVVTANFNDDDGNIAMALFDADENELDFSNGYGDQEIVYYPNRGEEQTLYLLVSRSLYGAEEEQEYTLDIAPTDLPECNTNNDTLANAANMVLEPGSYLFSVCPDSEVDYFQVVVPAGQRTSINMLYENDDGDLDLQLLDLNGDELDSSDTDYGDTESVKHIAGAEEQTVVVLVTREGLSDPEQLYQLTVVVEEVPDCDDGYEPNNTRTTAAPISPGTYSMVICDGDDDDYFSINLPRGGDISASVAFTHGDGDLDVKLYNSTGITVDSSATTDSVEIVSGTDVDPGTYYVYVYPFRDRDDPQPYTLELTAAGYCLDDDLGGESGNGTMDSAVPLRDYAFDSYLLEEDLRLCGGTEDWFRFVLIGDEFFELDMTGLPGLFAEIYREAEEGPELVAASRTLEAGDASGTPSHVYMGYHVPGRGGLYFVRVGSSDAQEQDYHLQISIYEDICQEDGFEYNDVTRPELATPAQDGLSGNALLCPGLDVDVYHTAMTAGMEVFADVSFDAQLGDIDLVGQFNGEAVVTADNENTSSTAVESVQYAATEAGDFYLLVMPKDPENSQSIPYDLEYSVVGGAEDGGFEDASNEDASLEDASGEDAGYPDTATVVEDAAPEDAQGVLEDAAADAGLPDVVPEDVVTEDRTGEDI